MTYKLAIAFTLFVSSAALAQGRPNQLCTSENSAQPQVQKKYCETIYQALTQQGPTKSLAEEYLKGETSELSVYCPNFDQLKGDTHKRAAVMQNLVAALIGAESAWKENLVSDDGHRGFCGIGPRFFDPRREAALNKNSDFIALCKTADQKDPNNQAKCCTYLTVHALKFGTTAARLKDKGMATYFGVFSSSGPASQHRAKIMNSMKGYCQSLATPNPDLAPGSPAPGKTPATE